MASTPLADIIQPFCTSLNDLVEKINGIHGVYQRANDKFYRESYNLVMENAAQVSFYGMGASGFFGSVRQSISDTNDGMQTLTDLATAVTKCYTSLSTATTSADLALQKAESILDSYRTDLIAIYGDATYPYTQLLDTIAGLDLNSIIQQGGSVVSSTFQSTSSQLLIFTTLEAPSSKPTHQHHAANAATAINQLTTKIQSICEDWANQVHTDVAMFNNVAGSPSLPFHIGTPLYSKELLPSKGKHAKGSEGEFTPFGIDIGPVWQGSASSKTLWQQSGHIGAIPVQNVATASLFNAQAGAHIGSNEDGTFDAGLSAGFNVFDLNDQALFGSKNLGGTLGGDITGPSADAQLGLKNDTLGADVGVSAATVSGSAGVNVAGVNVGITGSVGLKAEFGLQIGEKTEIKLPFFSVGFTVDL